MDGKRKTGEIVQYIHVKNLEKYHPGYKDRDLKWAKIYFTVVQGDPDFEMIESEIDKWRLICFIILELEAKKPIPADNRYLTLKGFDLKKRKIAETIRVLHNFVNVVTEDGKVCNKSVTQIRLEEDKIREEREVRNETVTDSPTKFIIPTQEEIYAYVKEKGYRVDSGLFRAHYESVGWCVGKKPMKNWRAAVTKWHIRNAEPDRARQAEERKKKREAEIDSLEKKYTLEQAHGNQVRAEDMIGNIGKKVV